MIMKLFAVGPRWSLSYEEWSEWYEGSGKKVSHSFIHLYFLNGDGYDNNLQDHGSGWQDTTKEGEEEGRNEGRREERWEEGEWSDWEGNEDRLRRSYETLEC